MPRSDDSQLAQRTSETDAERGSEVTERREASPASGQRPPCVGASWSAWRSGGRRREWPAPGGLCALGGNPNASRLAATAAHRRGFVMWRVRGEKSDSARRPIASTRVVRSPDAAAALANRRSNATFLPLLRLRERRVWFRASGDCLPGCTGALRRIFATNAPHHATRREIARRRCERCRPFASTPPLSHAAPRRLTTCPTHVRAPRRARQRSQRAARGVSSVRAQTSVR